MNMIIIGRLFQAVFVKPKNQTNGIHYASPIWRSNVNKAMKRNNSLSNLCETPPTLYCANCRKYKNFGHKPDPQKGGYWLKAYLIWLGVLPFCFFFNWRLFFYYYKKDWYDKLEPEEDLEHLVPTRPSTTAM